MKRSKLLENPTMNNPSLSPNTTNFMTNHSLRKENLASSGVSSENVRDNTTLREESANARSYNKKQRYESDAADKLRKEDDKWGAMNDIIENKEVKNNENEIKEDKNDNEESKKLKLNKKEVKIE